jgi:hypothetical protein
MFGDEPPKISQHRAPPSAWRERHPLLLAALAALVAAIIVGAAVGGGLGSSIKDCSNDGDSE